MVLDFHKSDKRYFMSRPEVTVRSWGQAEARVVAIGRRSPRGDHLGAVPLFGETPRLLFTVGQVHLTACTNGSDIRYEW